MDVYVARTGRFARCRHLAALLATALLAALLSSAGPAIRLARADGPPAPFLWGAATSSYQVEGGINCLQPGLLPFTSWAQTMQAGAACNDFDYFNGNAAEQLAVQSLAGYELQAAGPADDFWEPTVYRKDFDNPRALGMNSFRISLEWSRIEPLPGLFDQSAIDHYVQMLSEMRLRGLTPVVTLYHFALPIWAQMPPTVPGYDPAAASSFGGWESSNVVQEFVNYVRRVVAAMKDQVGIWLTVNEPMPLLELGYAAGIWSPGFVGDGPASRRRCPT